MENTITEQNKVIKKRTKEDVIIDMMQNLMHKVADLDLGSDCGDYSIKLTFDNIHDYNTMKRILLYGRDAIIW